ncbi:MAG: phosphatidylglycerophosphatase A [Desulfuromonadaceae bacterium]|nr:phosphatidylglycerophosphatase A [Desulfuromonadaceae bacterium]
MLQRIMLLLATNFGLGYSRKASGTVGTLAGIPVFYLISFCPAGIAILLWGTIMLIAFWSATVAGRHFGVVDDGRIVIDELVGYLTTVLLLPFSWNTALLAFILFRFFDIVKVFPANWFDTKVKNGYGVVLDDVVAGIYAAIVLRLYLHFFQ